MAIFRPLRHANANRLLAKRLTNVYGRLLMVLLTFVVLSSSSTLTQAASIDPCRSGLIPERVSKFLKQRFPALRLLILSDLTEEERKYWLKTKGDNKCPGFAAAHTESDRYFSYGMTLVSSESDKPFAQFLIVSERSEGTLEIVLREKDFGFVSTVLPGKYIDAERSETIQLTLEGILFEEFQKGAILYYWEKNQYHQLILSE